MTRSTMAVLIMLGAGLSAACFSDRQEPTATDSIDCTINLAAAAAAASAANAASAAAGDPAGAGAANMAAAPSDSVAVVAIKDFAFIPETVRIPPGGRVVWVDCEGPTVDQHTTTADDGAWDSGLMGSGDVYARTFDEAGDFPYHCTPHPFMTATVIVE